MKSILIIVLAICSFQINAQKIYQINTPEGFTLHAKTIMDMEMTIDAKTKPVKSKTTSYFRLTTKKVNPENTEFEMVIDSIIMTVEEKGKKETANSNIPSSYKNKAKLAETFEVIGKPMQVKVSKNGKLIKEEFTPQMADYCILQFSENPVSIGEAWETIDETENLGMKISTKTKNTIQSIENGLMKIQSVSTNEMLGPDPITTNILCDEATGLLKKYEMSVTTKTFFTMKMKVNYESHW